MPKAVLSSVVFLIGVELVDVKGMRKIFNERPAEFWVALITALVVIFVGVEQGILLAIVLSLLIHTQHGYKPKNSVLEVDTTGKPHMVPVSTHTQAIPGLMIYRFHHSAYYANAELLSQEVLDLVNTAQPPLAWFCIDATAMDDIDFSAAATLRELYHTLKEKGVRLVMAEVSDSVRTQLERSELIDLVGKDAIYEEIADVEDSFRTAEANRKQ
jgi:sulfate permease, SulP family